MFGLRTAPGFAAVLVLVMFASSACQSRAQMLSEQRRSLMSLRATTMAICEAWLAGTVSTRYARTGLEAAQNLLEKQRATLAAFSPDVLTDPGAQSLSESANQLARNLAQLWKAIGDADAVAVRRILSAVAAQPSEAS